MTFSKLIIATANKSKYLEFRDIITRTDSTFAGEIVFAPQTADMIVEETGRTYSQNAMLKAEAWASMSGLPCLADDSGLEVYALDGAPGLYSSRIIPGNDGDKVSWLLSKLKGHSDRRARFAASLALCVPGKYMLICEGYCSGNIAEAPAGSGGFGYDPVFIPEGYSLTFAQLSQDIKNSISHRAEAFRKIYSFLK